MHMVGLLANASCTFRKSLESSPRYAPLLFATSNTSSTTATQMQNFYQQTFGVATLMNSNIGNRIGAMLSKRSTQDFVAPEESKRPCIDVTTAQASPAFKAIPAKKVTPAFNATTAFTMTPQYVQNKQYIQNRKRSQSPTSSDSGEEKSKRMRNSIPDQGKEKEEGLRKLKRTQEEDVEDVGGENKQMGFTPVNKKQSSGGLPPTPARTPARASVGAPTNESPRQQKRKAFGEAFATPPPTPKKFILDSGLIANKRKATEDAPAAPPVTKKLAPGPLSTDCGAICHKRKRCSSLDWNEDGSRVSQGNLKRRKTDLPPPPPKKPWRFVGTDPAYFLPRYQHEQAARGKKRALQEMEAEGRTVLLVVVQVCPRPAKKCRLS